MDDTPTACPPALDWIRRETKTIGFDLASQPKTGAVLAALVASKPGGRFLELGTGSATAWLLAGMDGASSLDTVDIDPEVVEVAKRYLSDDRRVTFHVMDGDAYLDAVSGQFDLIFANTWLGKLTQCDDALALVRPGGFYVVDDLFNLTGPSVIRIRWPPWSPTWNVTVSSSRSPWRGPQACGYSCDVPPASSLRHRLARIRLADVGALVHHGPLDICHERPLSPCGPRRPV
jgi:hypothetical protein